MESEIESIITTAVKSITDKRLYGLIAKYRIPTTSKYRIIGSETVERKYLCYDFILFQNGIICFSKENVQGWWPWALASTQVDYITDGSCFYETLQEAAFDFFPADAK